MAEINITVEVDGDKLLTEQILELYRTYPGCSQRLIADAVGCSQTHVSVALRTIREYEMIRSKVAA